MNESDYTRRLKKVLLGLPHSFWFKAGAGPFQRVGVSDLIGCVNGVLVTIEVKDSSRKTQARGGLTPLQELFGGSVRDANGVALVVYTDEDPWEVQLQVSRRVGMKIIGWG